MNIDSGAREWSVPLRTGEWGSPAVAGDRVFAGGADGSLHALNAATGRPVWRINLGSPITTTVRRGEKSLFVGTHDGRVHRVEIKGGRILASRRLDARLVPRSAPLVRSDSLLVHLADKSIDQQALVSIDRSLNRVRWRIKAAERWSMARVFAWKNTVAVGTMSGDVLAFCSADGTPAWTHKVEGTVRAIAGSADALYVGTAAGRVEAIRPPSACGDAAN